MPCLLPVIEGRLAPAQRVVELIGGSTGTSLALVCTGLGHPLTIVTNDAVAPRIVGTAGSSLGVA